MAYAGIITTKRVLTFFIAGVCAAALFGAASYASASSFVPANYAPTLSEDFDTLSLDLSGNGTKRFVTYFQAWNIRVLYPNNDKGVKMDDTWRGENPMRGSQTISDVLTAAGWSSPSLHGVSGGTLKMRSYPIPSQYYTQFTSRDVATPYAASMISTEKSFAQQYGYFEVRAKMNAISQGQHFALWLVPQDGSYPPEIDMLESVYDPNYLHLGLLSGANSHGEVPDVPMTFFSPLGGFLGVWHTYGFLWTETHMSWYVDGVLVRSHPNFATKPMYIMATWEIGSNWPGPVGASSAWPAEIEFDYMRIYALPSATSTPPATPAPNVSLTAEPTQITQGQSTVLTWASADATVCEAGGAWTGSVPLSGVRTVTPLTSSTYTLSCVGAGGTTPKSVTVNVVSAPVPAPTMQIGDRAQVNTNKLVVRETPSTRGTRLGTQRFGALGTIVAGPTTASGYTWWKVNFDAGADGWVASKYLTKVSLASTFELAVPLLLESDLYRGIEHSDVSRLQTFLQYFGFFPLDEEVTNFFGPLTESAVREYQIANALSATGFVGPLTRALLGR